MEYDISALVLFCDKAEQTIECLESLGSIDIQLLDNGSSAHSTVKLKKYLKDKNNITYHKVKKNMGVARGRNFLIDQTKKNWLLFIDNDITIAQLNFMKILHQEIKNFPTIKAFIPKLYNVHEQAYQPFLMYQVNEGFIDFKSASVFTNKLTGGACFVHRSLFENGVYDEGFFVGLEDLEFAVRQMQLNKPILAKEIKDIVFIHDHRKNTNNTDDKYLKVRYDYEKIKKSIDLFTKRTGLKMRHDPQEWCKNQIKLMEKGK